jgi:exosortase A-associated hydrolase 1
VIDAVQYERGLLFGSDHNRLVGVIAQPADYRETGVLLLVGGPQYRVGSHRQFTLLARDLCASGIASLRFDYTGMGDSEGDRVEFSDTAGDLAAALDTMFSELVHLKQVVVWGLCDAASSAMMFAHLDPRIAGLVLLNPWVHGEDFSPGVKVTRYYGPQISTRDSWRRLLSGEIALLPTIRDFTLNALRALPSWLGLGSGGATRHGFVRQMLEGFQRFPGRSLVILGEEDLTAGEFNNLVEHDRAWRAAMASPQVTTHTVAGADHTFSRRGWKDEVARVTIDWIDGL